MQSAVDHCATVSAYISDAYKSGRSSNQRAHEAAAKIRVSNQGSCKLTRLPASRIFGSTPEYIQAPSTSLDASAVFVDWRGSGQAKELMTFAVQRGDKATIHDAHRLTLAPFQHGPCSDMAAKITA